MEPTQTDASKGPHFDISAAVVKQLGEELVTDEVTAVMELVKNSYDACATWVKVEVNNSTSLSGEQYKHVGDSGYIIVEDNGFGMSETDVTEGWMRISMSSKRKMKEANEKTECNRTPLGDKGLGRLSTQRLAQRIEMFTSKSADPEVHHVAFDWGDFKEEIALSAVPMHYANVSKQIQPKGTKLVLSNLKDASIWNDQAANKFKGQLSQLIFPFKEKRAFNVYLTINSVQIDLDELNETLRNQAISRFQFKFDGENLKVEGLVKLAKLYSGSFTTDEGKDYQKFILPDHGKNFYRFLTDKTKNKKYFLDRVEYVGENGILFSYENTFNIADFSKTSKVKVLDDQGTEKEIFANPGSFFGEIDDFSLRESQTLESAFDKFAQYKDIVQNQVGVRVFRDGFGIKPFGIDGEDWLKLGSAQTKGASFYGLRPFNTIGFVSLTADENKNLREKTDREGFMDTPYSRNFFLLMERVVDAINSTLLRARRSYNDFKSNLSKEKGEIKNIQESFDRLHNTSDLAKSLQQESQRLTPQITSVANSVRQVIRRVEEVKPKDSEDQQQRKLMKEIDDSLQKAISILLKVDNILTIAQKLEHDAKYIQPRVNDLQNQLSEFAELAGLGLTAEALSHEISNIVDRLLEQTNNINKTLKGKSTIDTSPVFVYVEYVKSTIQAFRKQLSHLAPSLRYVRENKEEFFVSSYISDIASYYSEKFNNAIQVEIGKGKDFKIKMSKGKLTQVFDNLIINSEYWLKEKAKNASGFKGKISIEFDAPYIKIFDNGPGVDPAFEERVFQPFVTSKPRDVGRGLGLFIVQQLLDTVGGEITLMDKRNENNRLYIFQINLGAITIS